MCLSLTKNPTEITPMDYNVVCTVRFRDLYVHVSKQGLRLPWMKHMYPLGKPPIEVVYLHSNQGPSFFFSGKNISQKTLFFGYIWLQIISFFIPSHLPLVISIVVFFPSNFRNNEKNHPHPHFHLHPPPKKKHHNGETTTSHHLLPFVPLFAESVLGLGTTRRDKRRPMREDFRSSGGSCTTWEGGRGRGRRGGNHQGYSWDSRELELTWEWRESGDFL